MADTHNGARAHVVDEASNDFLAFYNPMVLRMRETLGWFPMPAGLMLLNGIGHIALSVAEGRMVAGVWTSPLRLAGSLYLFSTLSMKSDSARFY